MSELNSYKNWRHVPQGTGIPFKEMQIAMICVSPDEMAEHTAARSAQMARP